MLDPPNWDLNVVNPTPIHTTWVDHIVGLCVQSFTTAMLTERYDDNKKYMVLEKK